MVEREIVIFPPNPVDISNFPLITDLQFLEPFGSESLNRKFFGVTPPGIYRGLKAELPGGMVLRIGRAGEAGTAIVELNNEHCLTVQQRHPVDLQVEPGFNGFVVLEGFYQLGVPTAQVDAGSAVEAARLLLLTQPEMRPDHVTLYGLNVPADAVELTMPMLSTEHRQDVELAGGSAIDGGTFDDTALGQRQIRVRRGPEAGRSQFNLLPGEFGYTTDEERIAIGNAANRVGGMLLDASKWVEAAGKTALPQGKYLFQQGGILTLPDEGFEPGETVYVRSPVALSPAGSQMVVQVTGEQDKIATSGGPVTEIRMQLDEEAAFVRTGTGWMCLAGGKDGLPVGTIVIFAKRPIPAGFLELNGATFSEAMYPTLFEHLGVNTLPNFADRYPKMVGNEIELLERRGWVVPSHTHEVTGGKHSHTRGTMDITGNVTGGYSNPSEANGNPAAGAFSLAKLDVGGTVASGASGAGEKNDYYNFTASRSWTGETSSTEHTHDVSESGNGDHVDPNHIGVIYAIKAAGARINGGLLDESGILTELAALRRDMAELEGGVPLFTTFWCDDRNNIPAGYAPADGQLLSRELFPTVAQKLQGMASRTISDATWLADPFKRGKYTLGDGETTFRLPDLNGRAEGSVAAPFLRGDGVNSAGENGVIQGDAARRLLGRHPIVGHHSWPDNQPKDTLFSIVRYDNANGVLAGLDKNQVYREVGATFDSAKMVPTANENRPYNVTGCFIIKLFSANNTIGEADAAQLATEVARLQSEKANAADAVPLLAVQWWDDRNDIPAGYVPADGQLLSRAMFPSAVSKLIASASRIITDADWLAEPTKRGKYTLGDGETTFRMPDYNGKQSGSLAAVFLRGDGEGSGQAGVVQFDAMRNITASGMACMQAGGGGKPIGAFVSDWVNYPATGNVPSGPNTPLLTGFDASLVVPTADENRPYNVAGCWIVKLYSAANVIAEGDASGLLTEIAKLQAEKASLEQLYIEVPVGIPQDWPLEDPPEGWICCMGQAFDKQLWPRLAKAYPSGVLPDLRGEFIRGWDNGRGKDSGRAILSSQANSIQAHNHALPTGTGTPSSSSGIWGVGDQYWSQLDTFNEQPAGGHFAGTASWPGKVPGMVRGNFQTETRPDSIAYNKIVRAA